jgi:CHASE3 domain sensor protein
MTEPPDSGRDDTETSDSRYSRREITARWVESRDELSVSRQRGALLVRNMSVLHKLRVALDELEQIERELEALDAEEDFPSSQPLGSPQDSR